MRISRFVVLIFILGLVACSSTEEKQPLRLEYRRTFNAPYETVWRATQQAFLNYPMNINNMDTGQLQTLFITGKNRYKPPHKKDEFLPSGYQYRLNAHLLKKGSSTQVIIVKDVRIQKDFFSEPDDLPSDGFEEKSLLYRIKREVIIEKLIKKKLEKSENNQS